MLTRESVDEKSLERFFAKVRFAESGCWEWTGAIQSGGYGSFFLNGYTKKAHRVSVALQIGSVDDCDEVDHICRNRRCVNPNHLAPVSHRENAIRGASTKHHGACAKCGGALSLVEGGRRLRCIPCKLAGTREYASTETAKAKRRARWAERVKEDPSYLTSENERLRKLRARKK